MAEEHIKPLVSAIVLSFDRKEETLNCLACLQAQTYENLEVIVVDNGSHDGSADAIAERFPEVSLHRFDENLGAWGPRDTAISMSNGKFIFMVDNDTDFGAEVIADLLERIVPFPEIGVVQPCITDLDGNPMINVEFQADHGPDDVGVEFYRYQFHGCAALIRREAYDRAGGFPHHYFVAGGEGFLSAPLVEAGYRILYYPKVSVRHAYSPKGRLRRQRFLLSNLHRMQNGATFNPFLARVFLDFVWKCVYFGYGAVRRGYLLLLPWGLWLHLKEFFRTLFVYRRPISKRSQQIIDYLSIHEVRTGAEYDAIEPERCNFWTLLRHRLRPTSRPS